MKKWKLGILGASEIAYRRFLPALKKSDQFVFGGIASRDPARCIPFIQEFGGKCYADYVSLIKDPEIDCIYLPLPPALHAYWGEQVLQAGKHLLMEKPFTASLQDTKRLLELSQKLKLAVHENYMFMYHLQLKKIKELLDSGIIGNLRLIRTAFTFPFRGNNDFRYKKDLGGGAILDCGGYPIRLTLELLGLSTQCMWSSLHYDPQYEVETGGSAVLQNNEGLTSHIFFGMDDTYRCELELWGNKASLRSNRIFTSPPNLSISLQIDGENEKKEIKIPEDDQFLHSIQWFGRLIEETYLLEAHRYLILRQSEIIDSIQHSIERT